LLAVRVARNKQTAVHMNSSRDSNNNGLVDVDPHRRHLDDDDDDGLVVDDLLVPPFDSRERVSTLLVATFNLVATIVGGGVLSLPLAFAKGGGLLWSSLLMVTAAYCTRQSLRMLCVGSRRTGSSSYGEVCRSAYGERAELAVSMLLHVFLLFVVTAYMILIRDIWTPIVVEKLLPSSLWAAYDDAVVGNVVLAAVLVLLCPFLVQRTLHSLRWNCYVGTYAIRDTRAVAVLYTVACVLQRNSTNAHTDRLTALPSLFTRIRFGFRAVRGAASPRRLERRFFARGIDDDGDDSSRNTRRRYRQRGSRRGGGGRRRRRYGRRLFLPPSFSRRRYARAFVCFAFACVRACVRANACAYVHTAYRSNPCETTTTTTSV